MGHESGEPGGDGRGGPARLQRVCAVGRAAGQVRRRRNSPLHKWLDGSEEKGRRYVLWGPRGVGKSTCNVGTCSVAQSSPAGLLDAMLRKSAGRAPSYEEVRGRVHELLQCPAWSRAWLAVHDLPAAGRRRAGEGRARVADRRVSVGGP